MLRLIRPDLDPTTGTVLNELAQRSTETGSPSWEAFRQNRVARSAQVFGQVWEALLSMARNRCAFCETPGPGTVEHLIPKANRMHPSKAFDWGNLLPACWECNSRRQGSGITTIPLDPSAIEPLDVLGWDNLGAFVPHPEHVGLVNDTVAAYGLRRFDSQRAALVKDMQFLMVLAYRQDPVAQATEEQIEALLSGERAYLGAVREYLLRPPTHVEDMVLDIVLEKLPAIRAWVAPWLNPPPWAARWL
jgi:hypothetical protein